MQRINEDIKNGEFKQMYLLYGEEPYLKKQYKDRLKEALTDGGDTMNNHYYEGKDVQVKELIDLAETLPFLANRRVIVIENSGLFKHGGEDMAEYLGNCCESTFFLFIESEVDKRSKLYKVVSDKGYASEFAVQDEVTLKRWMMGIIKKEEKQISANDLNYLLEKTGTDMENIRTELEKLFCYCLDRDSITREDIDEVCVTKVSNHIFDMVSAIAEKRQKDALNFYYDLLALKEPPMRILFLIARQCNTLLQVKGLKAKGMDNKQIGTKVGLPGFVAGKYVAQAAKFKSTELKRAVEKCVEAEEAVKTGRMNDVMSIELLILSVL